ncbi:excalibur calcium-binding domain-containing protein [Pseudomonas yamanorum]|uniref:excalibur calcium-binding domain-containing protein n=1 Tax=Pseudomonas yamanorum TaxID=515393 RepID=UPI002ECFCDBB|nr:excalibur calcium-binding domain-containing protein [Pseudomonas yamanorum]
MKLIVVLLIAGLLTWKLSPDFQTWVSSKLSLVKAASAFGPAPAVAPSGFKCDGRKYCSQMTSCLEAKTFLSNCPGMQMDGDNDGVPCERQWCH